MGPRARVRGHFAGGRPIGRLLHFDRTGGPHFGSSDGRSSAPSDSAIGPAESAGGGRKRASDPHVESSFRRRRSPHPPVHDLPRHVLGRRIVPDHGPARHDVHRSHGLERGDILLSGQRHERRRGRPPLERGFGHPESSGHRAGRPAGAGATAGDATIALVWSPPSSDGGSPITNYKIYRGTTSGGESFLTEIGNVLVYS